MTNAVLDLKTQKTRARAFRALHHSKAPLVLANAWDAGSAHLIAEAGARAIATTSGAQSWSQGVADGNNLALSDVVANLRRIVAAVDLPVSADIESGYGATARVLARSVTAVLEAGAVGINIEDSGQDPLYAVTDQAARIAVVRETAKTFGIDLFINARTDVFLFAVGDEEGRLDNVIDRAKAYAAAGADGIFAPGLLDLDALKSLSTTVDLAVNAMWLPGAPSIDLLAGAGVARVSVGTALAQVAYTDTQNAARALLRTGDFSALEASIDYFTLNAEFAD